MFTTAIIYDRKRQAKGEKDGSLEVRIIYNRKSYYINTGMRIRAKHWAGAIVNRPDADALNNRLRIIVARVNEKINELIEKREPIDVAVIKEYIYDGTKVRDKNGRLLTWIEEQIPMLNVSEGTRHHYQLLLNRLKQYDKMRAWSDLSVEAIYEWDAWLHNLANVNAKQTDGEAPITIGDDCFIGMNSIILKGANLGNNVIVGAGSVVHGTWPDNCVIAGNPAKLVKRLDE